MSLLYILRFLWMTSCQVHNKAINVCPIHLAALRSRLSLWSMGWPMGCSHTRKDQAFSLAGLPQFVRTVQKSPYV